MNVIVANERKNELSTLNIEIIKNVEGIYSVEELVGMFTNFFFNKMILDITAIKDYTNYANLKKLFEVVDVNKVILLLKNDSTCSSREFISDLVTLGVYNFTNNIQEIMTLFTNPKTFGDVSSLQVAKNTYDVNEQIDRMSGRITDEKEEFVEADTSNYDGNTRVIGVVNLSEHAGATTLTVQMVKQLFRHYKVMGIEMNKQDFLYFNLPDLNLVSCTSKEEVVKLLAKSKYDAVIVDLNTTNPDLFCTDVIYLVEPGRIKINKVLSKNGKTFEELSGKKIILNRSSLDNEELTEFEIEINAKIFCTVSNFRDNLDAVVSVDNLLNKLGYRRCGSGNDVNSNQKKGFFGKKF